MDELTPVRAFKILDWFIVTFPILILANIIVVVSQQWGFLIITVTLQAGHFILLGIFVRILQKKADEEDEF